MSNTLLSNLQKHFGSQLQSAVEAVGEVTIEVAAGDLLSVCEQLKEQEQFYFEQLIDLFGIDYLYYGVDEWKTDSATNTGFSRGVSAQNKATSGRLKFEDHQQQGFDGKRFASVVQLISYKNNQRLRIRVFAEDNDFAVIPSLCDTWSVANWYERESFDLFGIMYQGHPDLRRILTDYGFVGHPFRKDYPLIGHVEMRFDPEQGRVVYEPVSIEPRVLVPKIIRNEEKYAVSCNSEAEE